MNSVDSLIILFLYKNVRQTFGRIQKYRKMKISTNQNIEWTDEAPLPSIRFQSISFGISDFI